MMAADAPSVGWRRCTRCEPNAETLFATGRLAAVHALPAWRRCSSPVRAVTCGGYCDLSPSEIVSRTSPTTLQTDVQPSPLVGATIADSGIDEIEGHQSHVALAWREGHGSVWAGILLISDYAAS